MSDIENLRGDIKVVEGKVDQLSLDVSVLLSKSHTPLDCPLTEKVNNLQLSEARQRGAMAVIGTAAGLIGAGVIAAISRLMGK